MGKISHQMTSFKGNEIDNHTLSVLVVCNYPTNKSILAFSSENIHNFTRSGTQVKSQKSFEKVFDDLLLDSNSKKLQTW